MDAKDYQRAALRTEFTPPFVRRELDGTAGAALTNHKLARLLHGAIGVCTEAGELQDALKKHVVYSKALDDTNIIEEIGDLCWYLALLLDAVGSNFEDAFERNIAKLRKRYPDKFTSEAALNRDLVAERKALEAVKDADDDRDAEIRGMMRVGCAACGKRILVSEHAAALGYRCYGCRDR